MQTAFLKLWIINFDNKEFFTLYFYCDKSGSSDDFFVR